MSIDLIEIARETVEGEPDSGELRVSFNGVRIYSGDVNRMPGTSVWTNEDLELVAMVAHLMLASTHDVNAAQMDRRGIE